MLSLLLPFITLEYLSKNYFIFYSGKKFKKLNVFF